MSVGALVDLLVTVLAATLIGVIGFLLRGWVAGLTAQGAETGVKVDRLGSRLHSVERDVVRLTEAQKAVVANQSVGSRTVERLLEDSDEIEDKVSQLDLLTSRLYERLGQHDEYLKLLRGDPAGG